METLAYIHCASAYEELDTVELVPSTEISPSSCGLKGKKFSMLVALSLLPIIMGGAILGSPQEAQAHGRWHHRHCGGYCHTRYHSGYKYVKVVLYRKVRVRHKHYVCYYPVTRCYTCWRRVYL